MKSSRWVLKFKILRGGSWVGWNRSAPDVHPFVLLTFGKGRSPPLLHGPWVPAVEKVGALSWMGLSLWALCLRPNTECTALDNFCTETIFLSSPELWDSELSSEILHRFWIQMTGRWENPARRHRGPGRAETGLFKGWCDSHDRSGGTEHTECRREVMSSQVLTHTPTSWPPGAADTITPSQHL